MEIHVGSIGLDITHRPFAGAAEECENGLASLGNAKPTGLAATDEARVAVAAATAVTVLCVVVVHADSTTFLIDPRITLRP